MVAIATGHHSRQTGKLILIDPAKGRQENEGVQLIAPVRETPAVKIDAYGQDGELFQYPYPLSETEFLVTYHPVGWRVDDGPLGPRFGIYCMTIDGRRELLVARSASFRAASRSRCGRARRRDRGRAWSTTARRRAPTTCRTSTRARAWRACRAARSRRCAWWRSISARPGIGANGNGGPGGGALVSTPVAIGNGAWDPKIVLGDATVHDDGSAFFRVPARTPVYFQVLDDKGRMVQTMRSWTTLQPGENASCVGCHEHKNSDARGRTCRSRWRCSAGAETLAPFYGPPRGFSFAREIQPILDRQCVSCHDGDDGQGSPLRPHGPGGRGHRAPNAAGARPT